MHKKEYKVIGTILYKCSLSLCNRFPIMYIEYWSSSAGGGGSGKPFPGGSILSFFNKRAQRSPAIDQCGQKGLDCNFL